MESAPSTNWTAVSGDASIVYNRVSKTGSTALISLLHAMKVRNSFTLRVEKPAGFFPSTVQYVRKLDALPDKSVYVIHADFLELEPYPQRFLWLNTVREPISRMASAYYYYVDPNARSPAEIAGEMSRRRGGGIRCSCFRLNFNPCIRQLASNSCSFDWLSFSRTQMRRFCSPELGGKSCSLERALRNSKKYAFIGIMEEMPLVAKALERKFPAYFSGAHRVWLKQSQGGTHIAGRSSQLEAGSISYDARALLKTHWNQYADEAAFYQQMKQRFWYDAVHLGVVTPE